MNSGEMIFPVYQDMFFFKDVGLNLPIMSKDEDIGMRQDVYNEYNELLCHLGHLTRLSPTWALLHKLFKNCFVGASWVSIWVDLQLQAG